MAQWKFTWKQILQLEKPGWGTLSLIRFGLFAFGLVRPWGIASAVVTCLRRQKVLPPDQREGLIQPCCHLQLQRGCLLAEWGWAPVFLMQLWLCWCLEICWLLLTRISSSVCQIVRRKRVWGVHSFARNSGCLLGWHLTDVKSSPVVTRAGGYFLLLEWPNTASINAILHLQNCWVLCFGSGKTKLTSMWAWFGGWFGRKTWIFFFMPLKVFCLLLMGKIKSYSNKASTIAKAFLLGERLYSMLAHFAFLFRILALLWLFVSLFWQRRLTKRLDTSSASVIH